MTLVYRSGTMVMPFLTLYLTSQLGFTTPQAGWTLSVYGLGALAGAFLGGWLSDVHGSFRVMVTSLVLSAVALLLLRVVESPLALYATILFLSVVAEAYRPASAAAVALVTEPQNRARAVALRRMAINLGMTIGPAVGGILAVRSYDVLFVVEATACIVAAWLLWLLLSKRNTTNASEPMESTASGRDGPLRDGAFRVLCLLSIVFGCVFFQVFITFPLALQRDLGMREDSIGIVLGINAFLIVLIEVVLIHALKNAPVPRLLRLGAFLTCLAFGLLPFGSSFTYVIGIVVLLTFGEMLYMPFAETYVANRASHRNRGRYMGLYALAYSISFALAPILGTTVYDRYGSAVLWFGCGVIGVLLWVAFSLLLRDPVAAGRPSVRA